MGMRQYFVELSSYQAKNRAHAALQEFVSIYKHVLLTDAEKTKLEVDLNAKINEINETHTRCRDIALSAWDYGPSTIAVEGNFQITFKEVRHVEG